MERYGGLCNLRSAMREDEDVVLVNLCDDLNDEFSEWEVLDEIMAIFKQILKLEGNEKKF